MTTRKRASSKKTFTLAHSHLVVLGLSTYLEPSALAWFLNNEFAYQFSKADDIVPDRKTPPSNFEVFVSEDENSLSLVRIINNRNQDGILFPDLRNLDYIVQIEGEYSESFSAEFRKNLRTNTDIFYVGALAPFRLGRTLKRQLF